MNRGLLGPFVEGRSVSAASRRWWLVFLFGAPVALIVALNLQGQLNRHRDLKLTLTRNEALQKAREMGRSRGLPVDAWAGLVSFVRDTKMRTGSEEMPQPPDHPLWRIMPRAAVDVILHPDDFSSRWRVRFAGDGRLLGFEASGGLADAPAGQMAPVEQQRKSLEEQLRRELAAGVPLELGDSEIEEVASGAGPAGRRFTWHAALADVPSIEFRAVGEYRGDRLVRLDIVPVPRPDRQPSKSPFLDAIAPYYSLARITLIVFLALYACYRFARRAAEGEVPKDRALILFIFMALFGVAIVLADPDLTISEIEPSRLNAGYITLIRISILLNVAVQGLLLGLAYASGEGEVREGFPGKLTSLDAALTGRIFSSNVGVSVLYGAAAACWLSLLYQLLIAWLAPGNWSLPMRGLIFSFGRAPWVIMLLDIPAIAIFLAVCSLMLPLTLLRRRVRPRVLLIVFLLLLGFVLGDLQETRDLTGRVFWIQSAYIPLCLLLPFFGRDLLAAIVTLMGWMFLTHAGDLARLVPAWAGWLEPVFPIVGGTLGAFAWAAWNGRTFEDSEVRPQYAGNLARRVALQAEIGAAREAQLRLLPVTTPVSAGITVAASCLPAGLAGGDYYDFFPLEDGRLAFVLAEGGNDGLASALTIALAKGFLLVEATRDDSPTRVLLALDKVLGQNLRRTSGDTMIACGVLDPRTRTLRLSRLGAYPRFHRLGEGGTVIEIAPQPCFASERVCETEVQLSRGDLVFAYTDGVPHRLERQRAGSPEEMLRRAAGWQSYSHAQHFHDAVRRILLPDGEHSRSELNDDLTTVVLRINNASERALEEVA